jgi:hypothetical protein
MTFEEWTVCSLCRFEPCQCGQESPADKLRRETREAERAVIEAAMLTYNCVNRRNAPPAGAELWELDVDVDAARMQLHEACARLAALRREQP